MKFTEYLNNKVLCESLVEELNESYEIESLNEELDLMEAQLNEFLGLGKVAEKIKKGAERLSGLSDKADKKIEDTKTAAKDFVDKKKNDIKNDIQGAKYSLERKKNAIVDAGKKKVEDIKSGIEAEKEEMAARKKEIGDKFNRVLTKSKDVFSKFGSAVVDALTPEQKELAKELAPLFNKMKRGGTLSGDQALSVIAAVNAGITHGGDFPTKKAFDKHLTTLRAQPGLASFSFAVSYNRGPEEKATKTTKTKETPETKTVETAPKARTAESAAKAVVKNLKK